MWRRILPFLLFSPFVFLAHFAFGQGGTLPLNGSASGTISSSSQIDKWTVTTNADGNLTVTLANSGTSDFYAELLANDGITALSTVIRVNSSNANSASITASGLAPGSFIFEVYPVGTSTGSYTVSNSLATPSQGGAWRSSARPAPIV